MISSLGSPLPLVSRIYFKIGTVSSLERKLRTRQGSFRVVAHTEQVLQSTQYVLISKQYWFWSSRRKEWPSCFHRVDLNFLKIVCEAFFQAIILQDSDLRRNLNYNPYLLGRCLSVLLPIFELETNEVILLSKCWLQLYFIISSHQWNISFDRNFGVALEELRGSIFPRQTLWKSLTTAWIHSLQK